MTSPREIVRGFQSSISEMESDHDTVVAVLPTGRNRVRLEGILAEQFALQLGVRWEGFIHDLFVAYLLRGKIAFINAKKTSITLSINDRYGRAWAKLVTIRTPTRWTSRLASILLDPDLRNISISSADKLRERANELLGSQAIRFSLDPDDRKMVDFVIAMRNFLGHRSKASLSELRRQVSGFTPSGPNAEFVGRLAKAGLYLKTSVRASQTRTKAMYARINDIAGKLA